MVASVRTFGEGDTEIMPEKPNLSIVNNTEESGQSRFPDYSFEFSNSRFVSDTIEITPTMRVRGVISALEASDADVRLPATLKPLDRINKMLHQQVTIHGETKRRGEWLREEEVAGSILSELDGENHPVVQALTQLRGQFDDEELSEYDYKRTVIDTLKATHEQQFRVAYQEHISALR